MTLHFAVPLILASGSPRRREILSQAGLTFEVKTFPIDETPWPAEPADTYVRRLARDKAETAIRQLQPVYPDGCIVLAADTTVSIEGHILGKPADFDEAVSMWTQLSGRQHDVFTAVALGYSTSAGAIQRQDVLGHSRVTFEALSHQQMQDYWATGEPQDKAGGYAIQGLGRAWITHFEGSLANIIGLPIEQVLPILTEWAQESTA